MPPHCSPACLRLPLRTHSLYLHVCPRGQEAGALVLTEGLDKRSPCGRLWDGCYRGSSVTFRMLCCFCFTARVSRSPLVATSELGAPAELSYPIVQNNLSPLLSLAGMSPGGGSRRASQPATAPWWEAWQQGQGHRLGGPLPSWLTCGRRARKIH